MKNPGRKFIDVFHSSVGQWPNWDTSQVHKVGDYGDVNVETGRFEKEGNIYEHESTAALAANYLPITSAPEDTYVANSYGVTRHDLPADIASTDPDVAKASIKGQWEFKWKRGALVIITRPCRTSIPPDVFLKQLVDIPILQTKSLITEVVSSPAYAFFLSPPEDSTFAAALTETVDSATEHTELSWWTKYSSGVFRSAINGKGEATYTPMFTLKKIWRQGLIRRESPVPPREDDDLWVKIHEPWGLLDEEGEDDEFEDTDYSESSVE